MYLLDTCTCVELIRKRSPSALARLIAQRVGDVGISSITLAELKFGALRSSDPVTNHRQLVKFAGLLIMHDFGGEAAETYGRVRLALERRGSPIGPLDTLLAAHALALGAIFVTDNEREFRRVDGLAAENWTRGTIGG